MERREDWNKLRKLAKRLHVRLVVLPEDQFAEAFDPDIKSLYDPSRSRIVFNLQTMDDEDIALFAFAHELGHVIDHSSDPEASSEYGWHYHLARLYSSFGRELPESSRRVFQDREDMANHIGESVLEELEITISLDAREACINY